MNILELPRKDINFDNYKQRSAIESDYSTLLTEPCYVYDKDTGGLVFTYDTLDGKLESAPMTRALQRIKYHSDARTSGMTSRSRVFGFLPRNTVRRDFCTVAAMAKDFPAEHAVLCDYAEHVDKLYREHNPALRSVHEGLNADNLQKQYAIGSSVFTSGIANYNNPLAYHFDAGNYAHVWSVMLVYKRGVEGGYLAVPEYDVGVELADNSIFMFDGQRVLHGVTPITKTKRNGYRFSVVYYSMAGMWQCLTVDEELIRIRKLKTEREHKRVDS